MTEYVPAFHPDAKKEWDKIDGSIRRLFIQALRKLAGNPRVPGCELVGPLKDCYKIKRRSLGYRLVYMVDDDNFLIKIIAVGKREDNDVYNLAEGRLEVLV
ncbi:MAG: type II toxin-antitoxin system RelE/ParE family toxin [Acetobacter okinawensis]|uniref:type II toxin-antitoxin system RelE family toxin n=1 Tax=Acetobacter okinawensis TaxID=1076594 RepID=UPI0039ED8DFD